jgi:hypothetical protein
MLHLQCNAILLTEVSFLKNVNVPPFGPHIIQSHIKKCYCVIDRSFSVFWLQQGKELLCSTEEYTGSLN